MKKNLLFLLSVLILFASSAILNADTLYQRYLKLGNTYLHAGNFTKAAEYFRKSQKLAIDADDDYWLAASHEYFGYYYSALGKPESADKHFKEALDIFERIIRQRDGSNRAMAELRERSDAIKTFRDALDSSTPSEGEVLNFDNRKIEEVMHLLPDNPVNISLAGCRIKNMYFLTGYESLEFLNLSDNRIKEIPQDIGDLKNLVSLDMSYNRIKSLPVTELGSMKNLRVLNLKGNKIPFEDIVNLVRLLPRTNISFDEYEIKEDDEEFRY